MSEQLGTIELRVVPVHPQMRSDKFKPDAFAGVSRVHERSKKAGAHCVACVPSLNPRLLSPANHFRNYWQVGTGSTATPRTAQPFPPHGEGACPGQARSAVCDVQVPVSACRCVLSKASSRRRSRLNEMGV